jgi:tetratricopeptide (TPR) repeat protein
MVDRGESQPEVVRRAVQLLVARRRPENARALLEKYQEKAALGSDLTRLATQVAIQTRDPAERILALAARGVSKESNDPQDHLWLGQVYWVAGRNEQAEREFRRAVALGPADATGWVHLTVFLVRTGQKAKAEEEVKRAEAALGREELPYVLVPYYEATGQRDHAETQYLRILATRPGDPALLQVLAQFYLRRSEPEKAAPYLRQLMERPGQHAGEYLTWARRTRALQLVLSRDYRQTALALDLVQQNLAENPTSAEDLRAKAAVLAARPGDRKTAIRTLENTLGGLRPSPVEAFLLAQLYGADGDWPQAEHYLRRLVTSPGGDTPQYLAAYVRALLDHNAVGQAEVWAARLESAHAGHPLALEMRVLVLQARGEGEKAGRLVRDYVDREYAARTDPALLRGAAALLEQLGRTREAEGLFRRLVKEAGDRGVGAVLELAGFLARHDGLGEALDWCDRAWEVGPPKAVGVASLDALRSGRPTDVDFRRVERALHKALTRQADNLALRTLQGDLFALQGRTHDAEGAYRAVLKRAPDETLALNNLAWSLTNQEGGRAEALQLIERAIVVAGPQGALLDTRGMIRLREGQATQALADFAAAVAEQPTGLRWFHLLLACEAQKDTRGVERAWRKARELKLAEADLPVGERDHFRRLAKALPQ